MKTRTLHMTTNTETTPKGGSKGGANKTDYVKQAKADKAKGEKKAAKEPKVKAVKAPKDLRCCCGCGGETKGGLFIAGHDAKLKGMLLRIAAGRFFNSDIVAPVTKERKAEIGFLNAGQFSGLMGVVEGSR